MGPRTEYPHGDQTGSAESRLWYSSRIYYECLCLLNPLNVAVKPWDPREIPTHSCFPCSHVQSTPSLKPSPQQAPDYEKSPAGASHMQQTHPFSTTSDASPFQVWEAQNLFRVRKGTACLRWENGGHSALVLYGWSEAIKPPDPEKMTMTVPLVHCNIKKKVSQVHICLFCTQYSQGAHTYRQHTSQILKAVFFCGPSSPIVWQNWCSSSFELGSVRTSVSFSSVIHFKARLRATVCLPHLLVPSTKTKDTFLHSQSYLPQMGPSEKPTGDETTVFINVFQQVKLTDPFPGK